MKITDITPNDSTIYAGVLTEIQKNQLTGNWFAEDSYFNPILDVSDNWVISTMEMINCTNEEFIWVKDLDMIPYEPKPNIDLSNGLQ
jgi:hypothetical protein